MEIWRFTSPRDDKYASAGRRGSWTEARISGPCPECSSAPQERTQPLILVWEPGSDLVGDFVWPGFGSEVVAAEHVFAAFESRFAGFERGPIEMSEEPDLAHGRAPQVRLPYEGPALYELWTTTWSSADMDRSTIRLDRRCETCGTEFWEVDGVERWDSVFDAATRQIVRTRVERDPQSGIYLRRDELEGADIFRVAQVPGWVFCTDPVRDLVREQGFTNVDFLEMGEAT
jgi:hypothetical protein